MNLSSMARGPIGEIDKARPVLVILSGTVEHRVKQEAVGWNWRDFLAPILRQPSGPQRFYETGVIDRICVTKKFARAPALIGDGRRNLNTKEVAGLPLGWRAMKMRMVRAKMDPHKQKQLREAARDALMADYRGPDYLVEMIFGA